MKSRRDASLRGGQTVPSPIHPERRPRSAGVLAVAAALAAALPASRNAEAITPAEMAPHRQTVADVQAVGGAMIAWLVDQVGVQPAAPRLLGGSVDVTDYSPITVAALEALLVPDYIADVPELDGWGNPYDYRFDPTPPLELPLALIRTAGEDGVYEGTVYARGDVATLAEDLVWADGFHVRRPGPPLIDVKARAVRTRSEVTGVGVAMLSWYTDQVGLAPPALAAAGTPVDLGLFTPITVPDLEALLVPTYIFAVPATDAWGSAYDYYLDTGDLLGPEVMAVRGLGRGGVAEGTVYTPGTFPAVELDRDLVWADAVFVRQPDDLSALLFVDDFEDGDARHWSAWAP